MRGALVLLLALSACAAEGTAPGATVAVGDCNAGRDWPAAEPGAARLRTLVNAHRASRGLPALRADPRLDAAAEWKARHTAWLRYLEHDDRAPPIRRTFTARIEACGFRALGAAENIASGDPTPEAVMRTWLASPAHRRNMEGAEYTHFGVGAARGANGMIYWAQDFARAGM
ncbi:CAP domain-containing protein [Roseomonas sp. CCTCC AB2023176]|uniref:CAP domain-containing protein n=1 Tax=Roseomonas sp. CCTCC AB2023176 TaxID=3342640 RepID=UPI0035E3A9DE